MAKRYTKKMKRAFFGFDPDASWANPEFGVITPAPRDLIVYKKTLGIRPFSSHAYLTTLLIKKGTRVRWKEGLAENGDHKCRTERAKVLRHEPIGPRPPAVNKTRSSHMAAFKYTVGRYVKVSDFNPDPGRTCASGIHFFVSKSEATRYFFG